MSRAYEMSVSIEGFDPAKADEIKHSAEAEWPFEDWYTHENKNMSASGQSNLCGGESEQEFSERLTKAIWKANGGFCKVEVCATCLEDLPHETYSFDQDDYEKMIVPEEQDNA